MELMRIHNNEGTFMTGIKRFSQLGISIPFYAKLNICTTWSEILPDGVRTRF